MNCGRELLEKVKTAIEPTLREGLPFWDHLLAKLHSSLETMTKGTHQGKRYTWLTTKLESKKTSSALTSYSESTIACKDNTSAVYSAKSFVTWFPKNLTLLTKGAKSNRKHYRETSRTTVPLESNRTPPEPPRPGFPLAAPSVYSEYTPFSFPVPRDVGFDRFGRFVVLIFVDCRPK